MDDTNLRLNSTLDLSDSLCLRVERTRNLFTTGRPFGDGTVANTSSTKYSRLEEWYNCIVDTESVPENRAHALF